MERGAALRLLSGGRALNEPAAAAVASVTSVPESSKVPYLVHQEGRVMSAASTSFVHGLDTEPLRYETIGQALDEAVVTHAGRDALIVRHQSVRWTYSELGFRVDQLAAGFAHLDLEPGDRIGIWAANCAEWVLTQLASAKAGLILVNLNPAYRSAELEFALNTVGCRALVLADRFKSSDFLGILRTLAPEIDDCRPNSLASARLPDLRCVIRLGSGRSRGCLSFEDVMRLGEAQDQERLRARAAQLQSISNSPAARQDHRRERLSAISTSSTMDSS
jgi:fatty-acyl-CoA synthase